ncbi:hypothetical protein CKM354_000731600 [Cercospora kikuchii]|uniref:Uncharacterized protein n=1 Tax=Cercospora kikuchii TaxID=84275 RepID=A0A9P3CMI1_9PEZI|nr:uncharacterized protein CKM354_000731600 [Cercospora kikuchii]GIZ44107.1 hypothetical protein CKM354_000731600 [Cercospora kikuchii]
MDLNQETGYEARETQLLKLHKDVEIQVAGDTIQEYAMGHLEKTRRAVTHCYTYLFGWINAPEIGKIIRACSKKSIRHDLQTEVMNEATPTQHATCDVISIAMYRLSKAVVSMPGFVSANFQRDINTIAAESRAILDRTTRG